MTQRPTNPPTEPVAAQLLDQVHTALVQSNYGVLPELTERLAEELQTPSGHMTETGLRIIQHKADRNAACLLAAQRGIKAAQRRLADIRATAGGLVTYDRSGRRAEVNESRSLTQRF